jgi:hypothetical protein
VIHLEELVAICNLCASFHPEVFVRRHVANGVQIAVEIGNLPLLFHQNQASPLPQEDTSDMYLLHVQSDEPVENGFAV